MLHRVYALLDSDDRKKAIMIFISLLLMGVIEVLGIASIAPFMGVVTTPDLIHENEYLNIIYKYFEFSSTGEFTFALGVVVIAALIVVNSYAAFVTWKITFFARFLGHKLSLRLLRDYLYKPYVFFLDNNTADLGKNILSEVDRSISGVVTPAMFILSKLVIVAFVIIFLVVLDPYLAACVMISMIGGYLLIYSLIRTRLHLIGNASTKTTLARYKIAGEALSGIKDVKIRGGENVFLDRFSVPSEKHAYYFSQSAIISQLPRFALEVVAFGGVIGIVLYLIASDMTNGEVISFVSLYALAGYRLMPSLQRIYSGVTSIKYNLPALDIIINDLSGSDCVRELFKNDNQLTFYDQIRVDKLCFKYPGTKSNTINELNFSIKENTTVGLVGSTGSGKTTLVDILLGLLVPDSGDITIDGVKITPQNIVAWQENIGYVPQSIYLSDDSIEKNIAFAVPDNEIDVNKVKEAAKLANIDGFIEELPESYQTYVGERGVRLSGGQRQRIGIARALYNNPKVLIMDEATSALDGITERVIMEAINKLSHTMTIIMIAHRLTTVKECDQIIMMQQGEIIGCGIYNDLVASNQEFREMANA